jgi:hypothetical protein
MHPATTYIQKCDKQTVAASVHWHLTKEKKKGEGKNWKGEGKNWTATFTRSGFVACRGEDGTFNHRF